LSDDLQSVRDEVVLFTLACGKKQRVSIFSSFATSHVIASHLRTAAKVEATIDIAATLLEDSYVVQISVLIHEQNLKPIHARNVKHVKPSRELLQFVFVACWHAFRNAVREKKFSCITMTICLRTSSSHLIFQLLILV
jgi:hypothetical protein